MVPQKGLDPDLYAVERLKRDVLWLGHYRVTLKSDNEQALVSVVKEVLKGLKVDVVDMVIKHPPPYDSKASGHVENAAKQLQGMVRCLNYGFKTVRTLGSLGPQGLKASHP